MLMQELNMSRSTNTDCEPIFFKLVNADTRAEASKLREHRQGVSEVPPD